MKRKELETALKNLGFKGLQSDNKTLNAYNQIKFFVYSNNARIKDINGVYLDKNGELRALIDGVDYESGSNINND